MFWLECVNYKKKTKTCHLRQILDAKWLLLESGYRNECFGPVEVTVTGTVAFMDSRCMWPLFPIFHSRKYSSDLPS